MYNPDTDDLDEEYAEFLEENCKCNLEEDACSCKSFEDWFSDKLADYKECFDETA